MERLRLGTGVAWGCLGVSKGRSGVAIDPIEDGSIAIQTSECFDNGWHFDGTLG